MEQQEFDLIKRLKGLWRFKWMIAAMVAVAGGVTLAFTLTQAPTYEATATVMIEGEEPTLALPAGLEITYLQDIESQIEVMKSRSVLERAINQLNPERAADSQYLQSEVEKLEDALSIDQVGGTSLATITVSAADPDTAQQQADAIAEAYVYTANKIRLTAIEAALQNTIEQLKELRSGDIDLSISPSLTRLTTRIDTALIALEAASEHLELTEIEYASVSKLETISLQSNSVTAEANELSTLSQELAMQPTSVAVVESRTRALITKLDVLHTQIGEMKQTKFGTQIEDELLDIEQLVQIASSAGEAVLEQVISLSDALEDSNATQLCSNLKYRMIQHTDLLVNSLEAANEQLVQITTTATQWQLASLKDRVTSTSSTLQGLLQQLQPSSPEDGVILTHAELADMETCAWTVTTTLDLLLSEIADIQSTQLEPQDYAEILSVKEWVTSANDAIAELPDEIATLAESGGSSLGYAELDNLRQELQLSLITSDSSGIRVMDTAVISSSTTSFFSKFQNVMLAIIAALLLGILGAMVLQFFDRRVRDASQVTSYTGLPLLASITGTPPAGYTPYPSILLDDGEYRYLEIFRILRTNLRLDSHQGQVLLVSSPEDKEDRTTIAANLARVAALQGRKVLLIDANLRNSEVAAAFELIEADGLSDSLAGTKEPWDYVKQADGVDILPAGTAPASFAESLSSPRMKALMEQAKKDYDVVIVDSAPVIGYADTRILAREVNEVLLVLRTDISKLDMVKESKQVFEDMGVPVTGFVLNKAQNLKHINKNIPEHDEEI